MCMSMNESFSSVSEPETTIEYVSAPIETFVRSVGREIASLRVVVGVDAAIEFLSRVDSLDLSSCKRKPDRANRGSLPWLLREPWHPLYKPVPQPELFAFQPILPAPSFARNLID